MPAKQESMIRKIPHRTPKSWTLPQYAPARAVKLLNLLEAGLTESHGRKLTLAEVSGYAGQSTSTLFDWLNWSTLRQIECVIRIFEALPKKSRSRIINHACRRLPLLSSKPIAWSESQVNGLELVLRKEKGITLLDGDENARGFVFTAMAHSAWRISPFISVLGVDARLPAEFVPVPGVRYLNQPAKPATLREHVQAAFRLLAQCSGHFIILNEIGAMSQELQEQIVVLAAANHVLISGRSRLSSQQLRELTPQPAHVVSVNTLVKARIKIDIQSI